MENPNNIHPSVAVNAKLLKNDRKAAGYTQASFAAACDSVSLATIRRAEQGHRIIGASLLRMALILEQDIGRYINVARPEPSSEYAAWIGGEWTGLYVEADHSFLPYVITSEISIKQSGIEITGSLLSETPSGSRAERYLDCTIRNNVLAGFTTVDGLPLPRGLACINLVTSRNNEWLEGFSTWFDSRTGSPEVSRNIAVRKSSQHYERYIEEARYIITRELTNYRMRKLFESGYPIRDALTMLEAIKPHDDVEGVDQNS